MKKAAVVLGLVVLLAGTAWSVSVAFFEVRTAEQLAKGKQDDMVVAEPERLTLGLDKTELLKADGEIVWTLAVDATGAIYAGTSQKGKLYVIRGDKSSVAWTVDDAAVFAVAVGPDGKPCFGGSPSGTIYKDGKAFCKTGESYIWSLLFDPKGDLYAATGPDGKVFRIDATGKAALVLDSSDPHVMTLARDSKGNIYAGTNKSGLVYRLSPDGSSKVIYDASEGEIHVLAVDDKDRVYVGTADVAPGRPGVRGPMGVRAIRVMPSGGGAPGGGAGDEGEAPGEKTPTGPPTAAPPAPAPIRDDVSAANAVYRISPDGSVVPLYSIRGKMILSLLWQAGALYVGTGNRGDLIRIDENLDAAVLEKDLEKQVMCLVSGPEKGEILMGTGDAGRVVRYGPGFIKEGLYTSEVFDAKFVARFGAVTWTGNFPAGTSVELSTQSGNVAEPDASWSEWSAPYPTSGQTVTSPGARFIRYRAKLKTSVPQNAPGLDEVKIAYLTSNQPPRVKSVKATTPAEKSKNSAKPAGGAGQVEISWQAEDPNGDQMRYALDFRMRGDTAWRTLEEKTDKTAYTWKTEGVPDGTYEVRVKASDEPDNPKDTALSHSRVSLPFVVDNTRPTVTVTVRGALPGVRKVTVDVTMTDASSILKAAEYSLDSGEWQAILPDDRLFDSQSEKATVELDNLEPGEHTIAVRATDESENVGAGSRTFKMR